MSFVRPFMHFKGAFKLTKLESGSVMAPIQPWPGRLSFSAGGQPTRALFRIQSLLSGVTASFSLCSVSMMRKTGSSPQASNPRRGVKAEAPLPCGLQRPQPYHSCDSRLIGIMASSPHKLQEYKIYSDTHSPAQEHAVAPSYPQQLSRQGLPGVLG